LDLGFPSTILYAYPDFLRVFALAPEL